MPNLVPYELRFEPRERYLYACIECDHITQATSKDYLERVREKCRELGYSSLLIDRRVPRSTLTVPSFNIARTSVPLLSGIVTAWVNPFPENDANLEFAMLVANNRGARYALFETIEEAEAWLHRS